MRRARRQRAISDRSCGLPVVGGGSLAVPTARGGSGSNRGVRKADALAYYTSY